jgi:hypothetical protein
VLPGIDVSHYQLETPPLDGLAFLIARAAWGDQADNLYGQHIAAARRAGLLTGAYLFLRPGDVVDVRDQVAAFLEAAGAVDGYAVDWERDATVGRRASSAEAARALELVQTEGLRVGLYASSSTYATLGQDWRWVADYRPLDEPPIPWDVWQWASFAGGVHLDRNWFRGTRDELAQLWRATMIPAQIEQTTEISGVTIDVNAGVDWYDLDNRTRLGPGVEVPLLGRPSPYGVLPIPGGPGARRAIFVTLNGLRRVVLVTPAAVHPPVVSCDDVVQRELDLAADRAAVAVRSRP